MRKIVRKKNKERALKRLLKLQKEERRAKRRELKQAGKEDKLVLINQKKLA